MFEYIHRRIRPATLGRKIAAPLLALSAMLLVTTVPSALAFSPSPVAANSTQFVGVTQPSTDGATVMKHKHHKHKRKHHHKH
jgi:hypothetical protein